MFNPETGLSKLQLTQMLMHVQSAIQIPEWYEPDVSSADLQLILEQLEEVREHLDELVQEAEDEMEIQHLEGLYD